MHYTFPSIVYSQMLRYRRIINSEVLLKERLLELSNYFIMSGYPKNMVKNIMNDVLERKRTLEYREKTNEPPFQITWVTTFCPATPKIQKIVEDCNNALKMSETWDNVNRPIGVVHKRAPNLGNIIFKCRSLALNGHTNKFSAGTVRCTSKDAAAKKRGPKCKGCSMMSSKSKIISNSNGKSFNSPNANCNTKNVIYLAECRLCCKQYTGRTVQLLRMRISGHRGWMKKKRKILNDDAYQNFQNDDEAALSEHLKTIHNLTSSDDFDMNNSFTVIQSADPRELESLELKWISDLKTMTPFGLNISKPFGIGENLI